MKSLGGRRKMLRRNLCLVICFSLVSLPQVCVGQKVVWREEFNDSKIDRDTWVYDVGGHGFGNNQLEFNTSRNQNSYTKNGNLVIEARREKYSGREFTSARMSTQGRFAFQYGTLVARIKVPDTANGVWPAFWLLGNNFPAVNWPFCGEADILEIGSKEGIAQGLQHRRINSALHFADGAAKKKSLVAWHNAQVDLHKDFHLYKVEWTPDSMVFRLDDTVIGKWDLTAPEFREFHQPYYPILNVAIGSFKHTYTGIDNPADITAKFPARMHVDWIRLIANEHTKVILGNNKKESGKFGVYTEGSFQKLKWGNRSDSDFEYGASATFDTWNNLARQELKADSSEGKEYWAFEVSPGSWFGGGVAVSNHRNMSNYSDGYLHFDIRSNANAILRVGIKSSRGGESWLSLVDENGEFGFARDGNWHSVKIPLNRFSNIDFWTVHQFFMISGQPPKEKTRIDVDNIWWEPSAPRPKSNEGNFGIYTNVKEHLSGGTFESKPNQGFYVWEGSLALGKGQYQVGQPSIRLKPNGKNWGGASFTPNIKHDLSSFNGANDVLHFAVKTTTDKSFRIGMKSGNLDGDSQSWIEFRKGSDPYGLKRNGEWEIVEIPMTTIARDIDLEAVSQLFEYLAVEGVPNEIEFADICILKK